MVPDVLESFRAAERRRSGLVVREREQPLALIVGAHQRVEGLRHAVERAPLGIDVPRNEAGDRLLRHPGHDRVHHAGGVPRRIVGACEERHHHFRGQAADRAGHVAKHGIHALGVGFPGGPDDALEQAEDRVGPRAGGLIFGGAGFELDEEVAQLRFVAGDLEKGLLVSSSMSNDVSPCRQLAMMSCHTTGSPPRRSRSTSA